MKMFLTDPLKSNSMLGLITAPVDLVNILPPVAALASAAATPVFTSPEFSPTAPAIPAETLLIHL